MKKRFNKLKNRPYRLGLLIDDVTGIGEYLSAVWKGAYGAAKHYGIDLIIFSGGTINYSPYNKYEKQRNTIYNFASPNVIDCLLITCTLGTFVSRKELTDFYKNYNELPVVSIGIGKSGIPYVTVDNKKSMLQMMNHIIKHHGHRQIAFIRGPVAIPEANQRFASYKQALKKAGIEYNPDLVYTGNFMPHSGVDAVKYFLDKKKIMPQAIIAANDNMALGAIKELEKRDYSIPDDMSIAGFDDIEEARINNSPLTTIHQPLNLLGAKAVQIALKLLDGEQVKLVNLIPSHIIIRQSCGCIKNMEPAYHSAIYKKPPQFSGNTKNRQDLNEEIIEELKSFLYDVKETKKIAIKIINEFEQKVLNKKPGDFEYFLKEIIEDYYIFSNELSEWNKVIEILYKYIKILFTDLSDRQQAYELIYRTDLFIKGLIHKHEQLQKIALQNQINHIRNLNQAIIPIVDMEGLFNLLYEKVPTLGINKFFLIRFEWLADFESESTGPLPEKSNLIMALDKQNNIQINQQEKEFQTKEFLPKNILASLKTINIIVEAIYVRNECFGYAVFNANPYNSIIYSFLREQISNAIKDVLLFKDRLLAEQRLIETLAELDHTNQKLTELSIRDELTSLYNRRGFLTVGEQYQHSAKRMEKSFLLYFADLDGLKKINDTYGHKEGDNAIISTARILVNTFRRSDIIARIGGDEFTILALDTKEENTVAIEKHLKENIEHYNKNSGKRYKISISIGFTVYDPTQSVSFERLLMEADQKLYKQKQEKKKATQLRKNGKSA